MLFRPSSASMTWVLWVLVSIWQGALDKPIHEHVNELDFLNILSCVFDKLMKDEIAMREYYLLADFAGLTTDLSSFCVSGWLTFGCSLDMQTIG